MNRLPHATWHSPSLSVPRWAGATVSRVDAPPRPVTKAVQRPNVVRFSGGAMRQAGQNGWWVTAERIPCKVGGLGEVSKTIPEAIARYSDKDIRVMVPYMLPMAAEDQKLSGKTWEYPQKNGKTLTLPMTFQPVGLTRQLVGLNGQLETFELLQKFEPVLDAQGQMVPQDRDPDQPKGNWVYAIKNDKLFGRFHNLYIWNLKPEQATGIGEDAMFKVMMLFNRAVAEFMPALDQSSPEKGNRQLKKFNGDASFVIAHDWHTGPLLNELPEDYQVGKLFMLHNTYDEPRRQSTIDALGLKIPAYLARRHTRTGEILQSPHPRTGELRPSLKSLWSPLRIGIQSADRVVANYNYMRTNLLTDIAKRSPFLPALWNKQSSGRIADMHHGLSDDFSPFQSPSLRHDGFTELAPANTPAERQQALKQFKAQNRQALQQKLNLRRDPDAVIFNWVARFEPNQKGFYLLMDEAEDFLRAHPHAQLVMVGSSGGNPLIDQWIEEMTQKVESDPVLRGRLHLPNQFVDRNTVIQVNAGSDFTILPSLYEPYGLTQLECIMLGSIPVVHGVDGLRSTVSDPERNGQDFIQNDRRMPARPEKVWEYGQTGILMRPVDVPAYQKANARLSKLLKAIPNPPLLSEVVHALQKPAQYVPDRVQAVIDALSDADRLAITQAQHNFREALERALSLGQDDRNAFAVRDNGMRFVQEQHRWEPIVQRYEAAIADAVQDSQARAQAKEKQRL